MSQCTCLIRTNHSDGTHRLASMHFPNQIVGRKHTAHIQCQTQCHTHRQPFGHCNHNQGYCHHKVLQGSFQCRKPVCKSMESRERIYQYYIFNKENGKCQSGYRETDLTNQIGKLGKLYVQRSRLRTLFRTLPGYLSDFRIIPHTKHPHCSMTIYNRSTTQYTIGSICSFFIKISFYSRLTNYRFTSQIRFIDLQRNSFQQFTVSRNFFSCFQNDDISYYHIFPGNLLHATITDNFHQSFLIDRIQQIKFFISIIFKEEADSGSQQYGGNNTDCFGIFILYD